MTQPAISVLVDTYNHERFIEKALTSVFDQDFPASDFEIIVVDDGSTDRTPEIVQKFAPRVRLIRKQNGGQGSAFNAGIPEARGESIAFLDGDDWWAPNKLTRVAEVLASDPAVGIVGNGIVIVQMDGTSQFEILRDGFRFQANTVEGARLFRVRCSLLGTSRMTIRREVLRHIGPVPDKIRIQADEYLYTLSSVISVAHIVPETLTYYRIHEANGFQLSAYDPQKARRKWDAYTALATSIAARLDDFQIDPAARRAIVELLEASRDQLRLNVEGGTPWETFATEWKLYRTQLPDAPAGHRAFKALTLLAALAVPPRAFYGVKRSISRNRLYQAARTRWFPAPEMSHFERRHSPAAAAAGGDPAVNMPSHPKV